MVYKLKVYKLPQGTPQARGKAMVNVLPLDDGETITTVMALPGGRRQLGQPFCYVRHRFRRCAAQPVE